MWRRCRSAVSTVSRAAGGRGPTKRHGSSIKSSGQCRSSGALLLPSTASAGARRGCAFGLWRGDPGRHKGNRAAVSVIRLHSIPAAFDIALLALASSSSYALVAFDASRQRQKKDAQRNKAHQAQAKPKDHYLSNPKPRTQACESTTPGDPGTSFTLSNRITGATVLQRFPPSSLRTKTRINRLVEGRQGLLEPFWSKAPKAARDEGFGATSIPLGFMRAVKETKRKLLLDQLRQRASRWQTVDGVALMGGEGRSESGQGARAGRRGSSAAATTLPSCLR